MKWPNVKLETIVENLDSKRKPLNDLEREKITKIGLYPYIGANNIMGYVDEYLFDEQILCLAEDGGSWGAGQRCAVIYEGKTWVNNHAHVLRAGPKLCLKYLMYYLNHTDLNRFISGSTRGKLTKSSLNSIEVPLPPLHIQEQIANTLDKADALRRKDQELLTKYDELAQAIFYDMFGDPVRNEKGWKVKKLEDISKIYTGGTPSRSKPEYFDGIIPWITTVALNDPYITSESAQAFITEKAIQESATKKVKPGSLCFGIRVGVGKCSIVSTEICNNQDIAAISDFSNYCETLFLRQIIRSYAPHFDNIKKGATIQGVTTGDLKELNIILPELQKQRIYSNALNNLLKQKNHLLENHGNANLLFNGLMNRYFS